MAPPGHPGITGAAWWALPWPHRGGGGYMGTVERTAQNGQNGISPYCDKHLLHMRQLRPPESSTGGQTERYMGTNGHRTVAAAAYLRRNGPAGATKRPQTGQKGTEYD